MRRKRGRENGREIEEGCEGKGLCVCLSHLCFQLILRGKFIPVLIS
jgi:hypothetical protein